MLFLFCGAEKNGIFAKISKISTTVFLVSGGRGIDVSKVNPSNLGKKHARKAFSTVLVDYEIDV
jgi:hypothetical protein